jgi:hypothetical protein
MRELLFNSIAYAATPDRLDTLLFKINKVIINPIIEFSFIIALGVFLFGVMEFIRNANNLEKRNKGKDHMLWGIVGLLIMLTVFGVISLLMSTFGIQGVQINNKQQTFKPQPLQDLVLPK